MLGRKQIGLVAIAIALVTMAAVVVASSARADSALNANQLVELAIETNPQVRAMRAQWDASQHQILQNYAPADPIFTFSNVDASHGLLDHAAAHSHQLTENFQFPGKALLQADQAKRTATIARFAYEAAIRDLRAAVETGYYQILLDGALLEVNANNIGNLKQVLKVTETAYSGSQVSQTDFITAEVNLAQAELQQRQYQINQANDETALNQLLYRDPDSPLTLDRRLRLDRMSVALNTAVDMAFRMRQEILEAALTERNQNTALELAKFEYVPDYQIGYSYDTFLESGAKPMPDIAYGQTLSIGFNVPVFFWIHQREDVKSAQYALEAARSNLSLIRSQTAATVTQIFRSTQFAYESAQLYKDSLIPLANQDFKVALIAYQSNKIDFLTLSTALQASYTNRIGYLQTSNQFLAGQVALEQAIGASLPK